MTTAGAGDPSPTPPPPIEEARRPRWGRLLRIAAVVALLPYIGVVAIFAALQTQLIFPGHATQGRPDCAIDAPPSGAELVRLRTADGTPIVALFAPALAADGAPDPGARARPTVLDFYGNGSCLRFKLDAVAGLRRMGVNVLVAEYVGYGMSGGAPSEANCYATADAAYAHLRSRADVDPDRIVAYGTSLGGAVAIDLASRRPLAGLITMSTFTSMADAARHHYPLLPAGLLLRHRFESESKLARVRCPTLLIHGRDDRVVPFSMSARLVAALSSKPSTHWVVGADHNDVLDVGGPAANAALRDFLASIPARSIAPAP